MIEDDIKEDIKKHVKVIVYIMAFLFLGFLWVNAGFISNYVGEMTGRATGTVNLSVQPRTNYSLPAAYDTINWSYGRVTEGESYAILATTNGTVENGNWTAVSNGFIIENDGNVDLQLDISFGKTATNFLGGTSPEYKYNITTNESSSCTAAGGFTLGAWNEVAAGTINVCTNFSFDDEVDEVRVDFLLRIPNDSYIDTRGDSLSISVAAA